MIGTPEKAPGLKPGALAQAAGCSLPADLEAGSTTGPAANGATSTVAVGDHLDPQCILILEPRRVAGLAQRIQAALLRTRGCGGEPRQLEDHPRAGIHFRQGEGHVRPFGGQLDLGTGSYVARGLGVLLAIAAENDWRLSSSSTGTAASSTTCARTTSTTSTGACTRSYGGNCAWATCCTCSRTGTTSSCRTCAPSAAAAKSQASDITLAHGSVPGGFDLTGLCVGCDAVVDAVVDENVGIGDSADRAVLVVDRRGLPGDTV